MVGNSGVRNTKQETKKYEIRKGASENLQPFTFYIAGSRKIYFAISLIVSAGYFALMTCVS